MTSLFSLLLFLQGAPLGAQSQAPVTTVNSVDLERYQGEWFEVASIPQRFTSQCVSHTRATYNLLDNGQVQVINSCINGDGERSEAEGRARINPDFNQTSRLQVTFVHWFKWWWMFSGDYWVMNLDSDYQWSLVGHPERNSLWVLSRQETLPNTDLLELRRLIEDQGYDSCRVLITQEAEQKGSPLCDLNS